MCAADEMPMKKTIAFGVILVVLAPWLAHGAEKERLETEAEQIGLEWGQLLTQKVLKRFEATTGEEF